jgi:integrase
VVSIQKRNGKYVVRYYGPDRRERSQSFRRKSDAQNYEAAIKTDRHRGLWIDPRLGKVQFGDFAAQWQKTTVHLRPSTRVSYELTLRLHVLPHFGDMPLVAIERQHIQQWIAELTADGLGPGTIRNVYRTLARVLAEAEAARMIPRNPAHRVALPKSSKQRMRFLEPVGIGTLADAIQPRFRALIFMAGYSGLRWGELAALRLERLDLLRGSVDVRESFSEIGGRLVVVGTKSGERRTVPLPRSLCQILSEHISLYSNSDGLVFTAPAGGPLRRNNFYRRSFKPALRRAGLDPALRFHDLRHSAASIAINRGANVLQVQNMLGHSSATVTLDTYSHAFPALAEQLRDELEAAYRETGSGASRARSAINLTSDRGPLRTNA